MIEQTLTQLMQLAIERDRIEHKMGKLHLAARGLLNLVDDKAQREAFKAILDRCGVRIGLTDLVSLCLTMFDKPLTPIEIRNFITSFGSEASTQPNLLQSVHTTLRRLEGHTVKEEINEDGEKAYRLVTVAERLMKRGVEPASAKKVGGQVEKAFEDAWAGVDKSDPLAGLATFRFTPTPDQLAGVSLFRKPKK